jgi:hypothetical protein
VAFPAVAQDLDANAVNAAFAPEPFVSLDEQNADVEELADLDQGSTQRGQLLHVVSGRGLICADGGPPQELEAGDTVWVPPGERHWHGGGPGLVLLHLATSLGTTNWLDAVSDAEYAAGR